LNNNHTNKCSYFYDLLPHEDFSIPY